MTGNPCDKNGRFMGDRSMRLAPFLLFELALLAGFVAVLPARAQENRLPPGPGRDQVIAACSDCHGLVALNGKHMAYGAWYSVIGDMINNGASVPAEDRDAIAAYLEVNFGPDSGPDSRPLAPAQAAPPAAK
jgi:mono/diheme cytochrome c family protein